MVVGYEVDHPGDVEIARRNLRGERVATLVDRERQPGGFETTVGPPRLAEGWYLIVPSLDWQVVATRPVTFVR